MQMQQKKSKYLTEWEELLEQMGKPIFPLISLQQQQKNIFASNNSLNQQNKELNQQQLQKNINQNSINNNQLSYKTSRSLSLQENDKKYNFKNSNLSSYNTKLDFSLSASKPLNFQEIFKTLDKNQNEEVKLLTNSVQNNSDEDVNNTQNSLNKENQQLQGNWKCLKEEFYQQNLENIKLEKQQILSKIDEIVDEYQLILLTFQIKTQNLQDSNENENQETQKNQNILSIFQNLYTQFQESELQKNQALDRIEFQKQIIQDLEKTIQVIKQLQYEENLVQNERLQEFQNFIEQFQNQQPEIMIDFQKLEEKINIQIKKRIYLQEENQLLQKKIIELELHINILKEQEEDYYKYKKENNTLKENMENLNLEIQNLQQQISEKSFQLQQIQNLEQQKIQNQNQSQQNQLQQSLDFKQQHSLCINNIVPIERSNFSFNQSLTNQNSFGMYPKPCLQCEENKITIEFLKMKINRKKEKLTDIREQSQTGKQKQNNLNL
ncbi:hypothetical protein PPERSA_12797 [Pseudocohnilembus persalinus]|uniref:Uncharacterized protein n=1 Tax=Pseudocohnilembus persalinus TaxID=266149 RepID=A0A0V0QEF8_PSEPJ|nr:hypothetical protein PPERSA_12797 [Pseudocohnilembus persalinus]|eukprot:KRX00578.1 hypothetical protein PPERSA_12797 [Pseudocohnilembus persalinus]